MFDEDDFVPLSALQHFLYCPRQCGLIHLEDLWRENRLTAEGGRLHRRAHQRDRVEIRGDVRIVRHLRLHSRRLGLTGVADVVEFHPLGEPSPAPDARGAAPDAQGAPLPGVPGLWRPFPVEYKRGRPKKDLCDKVQLCAQALCLEEMLSAAVPGGALFYGRTRRRLDVAFDDPLRQETERVASAVHQLLTDGRTPQVAPGPKCRNCSLRGVCRPDATDGSRSAERYVKASLRKALAATVEDAP